MTPAEHIHVVPSTPSNGPPHLLEDDCWCQPEIVDGTVNHRAYTVDGCKVRMVDGGAS